MSLFYVTIHSAASTTVADLLRVLKPARSNFLRSVTQHSYLYRATDLHGAGNEKPEWMMMYEIAGADEGKPPAHITPESKSTLSNVGLEIHRQGLYSLETIKSSPAFPALDFHTDPNFLVAVFIRLHPGWKKEYDRYYAEEHMDSITKVPGWRRTRRLVTAGFPDDEAELVQLHDYDLENGLGGAEFKHATTTQWYKDMMDHADNKIKFLNTINNEAKVRRSTKSLVLGKASFEGLKEARAKRAEKDAAKEAKGKGKRGRKCKSTTPEADKATADKAERGRKRKSIMPEADADASDPKAKVAQISNAPESARDSVTQMAGTQVMPDPPRAPVARMW